MINFKYIKVGTLSINHRYVPINICTLYFTTLYTYMIKLLENVFNKYITIKHNISTLNLRVDIHFQKISVIYSV